MNKRTFWVYFLLLIVSIQIGVYSCANISSPTGGPKDTIPPALVKVNPTSGAIRFNDRIVRMEFSEPIQIKELTNQLIITPSILGKYKSQISKNTIELEFEEDFEENTTYTLNFREGIADLNEGNPAKDLKLAFSTGDYLDSLSITGQVKELLTNKVVKEILVSLYRAGDTLNTFNSRPYYLTKTNEEGYFEFNNLKAGKYTVYATKDVNKNLMTEAKNEQFGFLKDTVNITANIDSLNINILSININNPAINSSRPNGLYYEINLNKALNDYQLQPLSELNQPVYSHFVEGNKKVRIYNTLKLQDSLAFYFSAKDSINQQVQDTLYIRFEETKRSPAEFKFTMKPEGGVIQEDFTATLTFTKPIKEINTDSLFFRYDSLNQVPLNNSNFSWNKRRDELTIQKLLEPAKMINQQPASADTAAETRPAPTASAGAQGVTLYLGKTAFISVENDSSTAKTQEYKFADPKNFGTIQGQVATAADSFAVQLIQPKTAKVIKEVKHTKNFTFRTVPPGEYEIRVLIDSNGNGQWDPGNVNKREEPEPVLFSQGTTVLKANWEVKDIIISE
jgi:uncharacterized protein (DUF2141 family)